MIPSAWPTVPPVIMIIIFTKHVFRFAIFWKVGTDVRTEIRANIMITTGRDCGSAKWINIEHCAWKNINFPILCCPTFVGWSFIFFIMKSFNNKIAQYLSVINDPLGQTHSFANGDHYSRFNFVLFCEIEKWGRTDGETGVQILLAKIVIITGRD